MKTLTGVVVKKTQLEGGLISYDVQVQDAIDPATVAAIRRSVIEVAKGRELSVGETFAVTVGAVTE